jgi:hypothetical protein
VIAINDLVKALDRAAIVPSSEQLYDRDGLPVDLVNDPDKFEIHVYVTPWNSPTSTLPQKWKLGIHEVLGLLRIPDPSFRISEKLRNLAMRHMQVPINNAPTGQLPVGISQASQLCNGTYAGYFNNGRWGRLSLNGAQGRIAGQLEMESEETYQGRGKCKVVGNLVNVVFSFRNGVTIRGQIYGQNGGWVVFQGTQDESLIQFTFNRF